jgi:hypothetical protein
MAGVFDELDAGTKKVVQKPISRKLLYGALIVGVPAVFGLGYQADKIDKGYVLARDVEAYGRFFTGKGLSAEGGGSVWMSFKKGESAGPLERKEDGDCTIWMPKHKQRFNNEELTVLATFKCADLEPL